MARREDLFKELAASQQSAIEGGVDDEEVVEVNDVALDTDSDEICRTDV